MLLAERLRREEPAWGGEWRPGLLHAAAGAHCVQQVMIVMVMMMVMMTMVMVMMVMVLSPGLAMSRLTQGYCSI